MLKLIKQISPKFIVSLCVLLIFIQFAFQLKLAKEDSPTTDEAVHLIAGYTYLTKGDYRFNPEHPPLLKTLSAVPLLFIEPNLPAEFDELWEKSNKLFYDSWAENRTLGDKFMYTAGNNPNQLIFWGRIPTVLITLLLAITIFVYSKKVFGVWGALIATALFTTNPIVNGHGHLITTDLILALTYLLTVITGYKLVQKRNLLNAVLFGLCLGLALSSKHTAIILLPIIFVSFISLLIVNFKKTIKLLPLLLVSMIAVVIVIWASYGFNDFTAPKLNSITTEIVRDTNAQNYSPSARVDRIYNFIQPVLRVLPFNYLKGVTLVLTHTGGGHGSYLLGETSNSGWWYYFPFLLAVKSPLPFLLALAFALYALVRKQKKLPIWAMLVFALGFLAVAMTSRANLGVRHIMPIIPLLIILGTWGVLQVKSYRVWGLLISIWAIAIFLTTFPTYLGYFNEFVGGSKNAHKIATDSNLDWGQDMLRIKKYLEKNAIDSPVIEYGWLGKDGLDYYIQNYRLLTATAPSGNDTIIINASSYVVDYKDTYKNCNNSEISNAVFVCKLND